LTQKEREGIHFPGEVADADDRDSFDDSDQFFFKAFGQAPKDTSAFSRNFLGYGT